MPLHDSHIYLISAARKARDIFAEDDEFDFSEILVELNLALWKYDSKLKWHNDKLPHARFLFDMDGRRGIFTCKFCHTVYDRTTAKRVNWNPPTENGCDVCVEALKCLSIS